MSTIKLFLFSTFPIFSDCQPKKIVLGSVNNQSKTPLDQRGAMAEKQSGNIHIAPVFPAVSEDCTTPFGTKSWSEEGFEPVCCRKASHVRFHITITFNGRSATGKLRKRDFSHKGFPWLFSCADGGFNNKIN